MCNIYSITTTSASEKQLPPEDHWILLPHGDNPVCIQTACDSLVNVNNEL